MHENQIESVFEQLQPFRFEDTKAVDLMIAEAELYPADLIQSAIEFAINHEARRSGRGVLDIVEYGAELRSDGYVFTYIRYLTTTEEESN